MADSIAPASKETVRLWRIWRTTRQMLRDRGYEILEEEVEVSLDDFRARFHGPAGENIEIDRNHMAYTLKPSLEMIARYTKSDRHGNKKEPEIGTIRVEFNGDTQIGVKTVRNFAHTMEQNSVYSGILVTAVSVSSACHKIAQATFPKVMELFEETDLIVNITQHELVPKHIMLSPEEKQALLERYRLKHNQLPRILKEDPVARYLALRRGDIVKIIRASVTAGRYATYRTCQ
ncbi:RPB5 subunit of DNA-directed RNA polymerase [Microthyrium microscopicum]|uniref:DNA-directed RNA polymerases I, II, and III subunit RPABC1 n=1 Tax=Microthyrium microscopicum TaxID=703497 RepID=A0A6A6TWL1_9PEZI|nr:RPB5 subunit of DNA-directed RNA polymerase [Microthyrium microscopicum]